MGEGEGECILLAILRKKKYRWIGIAALVVIGLLSYGAVKLWWHTPPKIAAMPPAPVTVAIAKQKLVPQIITAVGSLRSLDVVTISPEIAGSIKAILFTAGQHVPIGAPLIELDNSIYAAALQSAKANLALSQLDFKRTAALLKRHVVSEQTYDQAKATLQAQEAQVKTATTQLQKMTLRAPFAGIIGAQRVSIGAYVAVGQNLATLVNKKNLVVDYQVPEKYLPDLHLGQVVQLSSSAYPKKIFSGYVSFIAPSINEATRTIAIEGTIPNATEVLTPGMFVTIKQQLANISAVLVPAESLVPTIEGQKVYRVINNRAITTPVTVGEIDSEGAQVLTGLKPGDTVVTTGQLRLKDDAPVEIVTPSTVIKPTNASQR